MIAQGVFSVLPSPFSATGDFDPDSLARVIDLFLADGVNGFTALGVTSEVARLTDAERDRVLDAVLARVNGRVPVVAVTTADGLRTCVEYTRRARSAGASAGAMTGFAFPAILVKIVSLYRAGKIDEAGEVFYAKVPLMRFEFQEGIGMAIRKEVLRRRGAIANAAIRPPGGMMDATTREALDRVMAWCKSEG